MSEIISIPGETISIPDSKIELEKHMEDCIRKLKNNKSIDVKTLRCIIPRAIIRYYHITEDPNQAKCKGMWNRPPPGWPPGVAYCDPNNKSPETNCRPKQKVLTEMLVKGVIPAYQAAHSVHIHQVVNVKTEYVPCHTPVQVQESSEAKQDFSTWESVSSIPQTTLQVLDDGFEDSVMRSKDKMAKIMDPSVRNLLINVAGILEETRGCAKTQEDLAMTIRKAFELEADIAIAAMFGLELDRRNSWEEFQNRRKAPVTYLPNQKIPSSEMPDVKNDLFVGSDMQEVFTDVATEEYFNDILEYINNHESKLETELKTDENTTEHQNYNRSVIMNEKWQGKESESLKYGYQVPMEPEKVPPRPILETFGIQKAGPNMPLSPNELFNFIQFMDLPWANEDPTSLPCMAQDSSPLNTPPLSVDTTRVDHDYFMIPKPVADAQGMIEAMDVA